MLLCLLIGMNVQAEKLDLSAHNAIILKLESTLSLSTEDSMVQHVPIIHRLADLYAERARLLTMEDEGRGAQKFAEQIKSDRKKSVLTLQKILSSLSKAEKGSALLQIAHLGEMLSENEEALKIYRQIEKNPNEFDNVTKALTEIKLGDYAFVNNDLTKSQKHFENAVLFPENPRKSYSYYRLAWVHYNLGQTLIAESKLYKLLQTPSLFKTKSGQTDESFVEEATHDLATFIARNDLTQTSLKSYMQITPEKLRKKNLIYLAQELDRTSKKANALKVWAIVGAQNLSFEDQIDRQINITRIEYELSQFNLLLAEIDKSILIIKKSTCTDNPVCTLAKENLRHIITDWARAEERKVSAQLITAFSKYTSNFEDYEMNFWAAGLADKREQHQDAFIFYARASTLLKDIQPKNPQQQKLFESSLIGGIEMADYAKDPQMKMQAYKRYLEFNPNGAQKNEVKYQIARWFYDQSDLKTAHGEFKKLSLDATMNLSLREKSADLCLDTNVLLKDETSIEKDSYDLAQHLKNKKSEYLSIWRKSILNQTATLLNSKQTLGQLKDELIKLNKIDSQSFQNNEKIMLVKNKIEISFRLKEIDSLIQFSNELLAIKSINQEDQQKALHYLAWTSEIRMNFKESLKFMRSIHPKPKNLAAYYLKVALLKELSQQNPTRDYESFIAASRDKSKVQFAAHQIILNSSRPRNAFAKYESLIKKNADLYPSAAMSAYEQSKDPSFSTKLLSQSAFKNTAEASLIRHQNRFADFRKMSQRFASEKLKAGSDSSLKRALVRRNGLIHQLEQFTNQSIAKRDTVEQLVFLPLLAIENKRLADEILALPQPRKLSKTEKQMYDEQLKTMVTPYLKQSLAIEAKVKELWKQDATQSILTVLSDWSVQINRPGHNLATQELSLLKTSVQSLGLSSDAFEKLTEKSQKVSSEAFSLQSKIYKNPFDYSYLEKMKSLHLTLGSGPMVAYIDSRMIELNSRGR